MKHPWTVTLVLLIVLTALGAGAGRLAAPAMARLHPVVKIAEEVRNDARQPREQPDDRVKAFRQLGLPPATLYAQAREVQGKFALGAALFGAWCGLVSALKIGGALAWRRRREYDAHPGDCLACARCFESCPVEIERRRQRVGEDAL